MKRDSRIEKVGAALRRQRGANVIIARQDEADVNLYHGAAGVTYTIAELERLAETQSVVRITYQDGGQPLPGEKVIRLDDAFGNLITSDDAGQPHNLMNEAGDK